MPTIEIRKVNLDKSSNNDTNGISYYMNSCIELESKNKELEACIDSLRIVEDDNNDLIHDLMMKIQYLEGKLAGYQECLRRES